MSTVVVLLSDKRSGSTILQDELCRHADIRHVAYSPHTYFETHHWLKAAVVLNRPARFFSGGKVYDGYGSRLNARAYMLDLLQRNLQNYTDPGDDQTLVYQGWETLCSEMAQPVFFEKSPQLLAHWAALDLFLDWVSCTTHTVKVIGLVRNPFAVQYSAQELFSSDPEVRQLGWLDIQKNLLAIRALLPEEHFCLVRYEDMISQPGEFFSDLCRFIGVVPNQKIGSGVRASSRARWREDSRFTLQLDPAVRRMTLAFGYSSDELTNPNKRAPSVKNRGIFRRLQKWIVRRRDQIWRPYFLRLRKFLRQKL